MVSVARTMVSLKQCPPLLIRPRVERSSLGIGSERHRNRQDYLIKDSSINNNRLSWLNAGKSTVRLSLQV